MFRIIDINEISLFLSQNEENPTSHLFQIILEKANSLSFYLLEGSYQKIEKTVSSNKWIIYYHPYWVQSKSDSSNLKFLGEYHNLDRDSLEQKISGFDMYFRNLCVE